MPKEKFEFDFSKEEDQKRFLELPAKIRKKLILEAQDEANRIKEKIEKGEAKDYEEASLLVEKEKIRERLSALHEKEKKLTEKLKEKEWQRIKEEIEKEQKELEKSEKPADHARLIFLEVKKYFEYSRIFGSTPHPFLRKWRYPEYYMAGIDVEMALEKYCDCDDCQKFRSFLHDDFPYSSIFAVALIEGIKTGAKAYEVGVQFGGSSEALSAEDIKRAEKMSGEELVEAMKIGMEVVHKGVKSEFLYWVSYVDKHYRTDYETKLRLRASLENYELAKILGIEVDIEYYKKRAKGLSELLDEVEMKISDPKIVSLDLLEKIREKLDKFLGVGGTELTRKKYVSLLSQCLPDLDDRYYEINKKLDQLEDQIKFDEKIKKFESGLSELSSPKVFLDEILERKEDLNRLKEKIEDSDLDKKAKQELMKRIQKLEEELEKEIKKREKKKT